MRQPIDGRYSLIYLLIGRARARRAAGVRMGIRVRVPLRTIERRTNPPNRTAAPSRPPLSHVENVMVGRLLLVDPDPWRCELILRGIGEDTHGDWCTTYEAARTQLVHGHYDLLVTNVRLDAYNGLQLVYLAQFAELPTRSLVYDVYDDPVLARDARQAGAFYEPYSRLTAALPGYLRGCLPPKDRRMATELDRRHIFRPGRRAADIPIQS